MEKKVLIYKTIQTIEEEQYYTCSDELWNKIKQGELKGLSIEGYFTDKMEQMSEKAPTTEEILSALNEIISENQTK